MYDKDDTAGQWRIRGTGSIEYPYEKMIVVPPALLRYNWHIILSEYKVYNVVIWYTYILQNDYCHSVS